MYVKVEPSGCCIRKGMVQIRLCMYLEPTDYGYEKHHVEIYARELTQEELDNPALADLVPKVWQNNPFHNHFIYVDPTVTNTEILNIARSFLNEAYTKWASNTKVDFISPPFKTPTINTARLTACENKMQSIKTIVSEIR